MNKREEALNYHSEGRPGKIEVVPTKPYSTQRDLALAYSPGVAEPCLEIEKNPEDAYKYTDKGNLVAVISNGTAVLGLGDIGALASKPVMEGKGLLFKVFADIDVFDIEVDEKDPEKFIETVKAISVTFGGINLEDIKAPEAFEIERRLVEELDIPVMHDDQHGTAIISTAALINAAEIVNKKLEDLKIVVNGAGAAAISCTHLYISLGCKAENIIMCDSKGVLNKNRKGLTKEKLPFVRDSKFNTLEEAIVGADVFVGLSKGNVLTPKMLLTMANDPIVFALANPTPEIDYHLALSTRKDIIMGTGRSDTANQVNNVLGFPYIFRGALDVRAKKINEEMKVAAVKAIAELAHKNVPGQVMMAYNTTSMSFGRDYIIPKPFDSRLILEVAPAVARAAMESGVARKPIMDWEAYHGQLEERMSQQSKLIRLIQNKAIQEPKRVVFPEADRINILRAANQTMEEGACKPILLGNKKIITALMAEHGMEMQAEIYDPKHSEERELVEKFAQSYWKKYQRRGITLYEARRRMHERDYFAAMLLKSGRADAMVTGFSKSYSNASEAIFSILDRKDEKRTPATVNIVKSPKGELFIADTSVNKNPSEDELFEIVLQTADFVRFCGIEPKIAMVSYSNFGLDKDSSNVKLANVVARLHKEKPELIVDGEMQPDFALSENLLSQRFPFSKLVGKGGANVLIFPSSAFANVSLKLLRGIDDKNTVLGPVMLGLEHSAHVVYTGSSTEEICNAIYFAVADAQDRK